MTHLSNEDVKALGGHTAAEQKLSDLVALIEENGGFLKDAELGRTLGPNPDLSKIITIPGYGVPAFQFEYASFMSPHGTLSPRVTPVAYAAWRLDWILNPCIGGGDGEEEQ